MEVHYCFRGEYLKKKSLLKRLKVIGFDVDRCFLDIVDVCYRNIISEKVVFGSHLHSNILKFAMKHKDVKFVAIVTAWRVVDSISRMVIMDYKENEDVPCQ